MICIYCGKPGRLKPTSRKWICGNGCNASTGIYAGTTDKPAGFMAKKPIRELRKKAHDLFDTFWRRRESDDSIRREQAYQWLAAKLGVEEHWAHMGMMDEPMLEEVIRICEERIENEHRHTAVTRTDQ